MKSTFSNIFSTTVCLYFALAILVFEPYYSWKYAKTHTYAEWTWFGEAVASEQAIGWPIYIFSSTDESVLHVKKAMNNFNDAVTLINSGTPYSQISGADRAEISQHLREALAEARQANIESMNQHYPTFGDHYAQEFIPGLELLIANYDNGDLQAAASASILLDKWDNWHRANIRAIRER